MAYKRIHVFYSGRVQGVSFRYTAQDIANELGLVGWAKNLRDGRVEIVCEGEEKKLKEFLDHIDNNFHIRAKDIAWKEPLEGFSNFDIRF